MDPLKPGLEGKATVRVTGANTANALGNRGVDVFATPFMAALVEEACRNAVEPLLPPGTITLGGSLDLQHLAPTPPGFEVSARARVVEVKGPKVVFEAEVSDGVEKVGEARHVRFLAKESEFLERVSRKAARKLDSSREVF
jgi:fluoroacetyl-CoA thioesterase